VDQYIPCDWLDAVWVIRLPEHVAWQCRTLNADGHWGGGIGRLDQRHQRKESPQVIDNALNNLLSVGGRLMARVPDRHWQIEIAIVPAAPDCDG